MLIGRNADPELHPAVASLLAGHGKTALLWTSVTLPDSAGQSFVAVRASQRTPLPVNHLFFVSGERAALVTHDRFKEVLKRSDVLPGLRALSRISAELAVTVSGLGQQYFILYTKSDLPPLGPYSAPHS